MPSGKRDGDDLVGEAAAIMPGAPAPAARLITLLDRWRTQDPAPLRLVTGLGDRLARAVAARFLQLLDLNEIRKSLETALSNVLPTRRKLEYNYRLPLKRIEFGGVSFEPGGNNEILLTATGEVDLRNLVPNATGGVDPRRPISVAFSASGRTGEFSIDIKEYLSFRFGAFTFNSDRNGTRLDAPLKGVLPGQKLLFLAALAAWMALRGGGGGGNSSDRPSGPYVRRRGAGPGLLAGYGLTFDSFSIGTIGFANVVFDAYCELPFDDTEALVRIRLSSPDSPFVISAAPYGGGGHVALTAAANGLRGVDLSLQWGGAAIVSYGPLQGIGRIMTGIQVQLAHGAQAPVLSGVFSAAFVGHVACFGIAASFYLAMSYGSGRMQGTATLTYEFSLGIAKAKFRVNIKRDEGAKLGSAGGGAGGSASWDSGRGAPRTMLAALGAVPPPSPLRRAEATSDIASPLQDWATHRLLYTRGLRAAGRRRR